METNTPEVQSPEAKAPAVTEAKMPIGMKILSAYFSVLGFLAIWGTAKNLISSESALEFSFSFFAQNVWPLITAAVLGALVFAMIERKRWGAKAIIAWEAFSSAVGLVTMVIMARAVYELILAELAKNGIAASQIATREWVSFFMPIILAGLFGIATAVVIIVYTYKKRAYFSK